MLATCPLPRFSPIELLLQLCTHNGASDNRSASGC